MKYLLILLLILLGCDTKQPQQHFEAQYKLGDKVRMTDSFYSLCYGVITGYSEPNNYHVNLYCPNLSENYGMWVHYADIAERIK